MKETTYTVTTLGRTFEFTHADTVLPFLALAEGLLIGHTGPCCSQISGMTKEG